MVDFSRLKSMSGKKTLERLTNEVSKFATSSQTKDDRFWYPSVDKAGNGYAVVRFLPPPGDEDVPFVRVFTHGFKGPTGSWYIENSLTTIGQNDPVSEYNSALWNSGLDSDKELARKQKRKLGFISNVEVIEDSLHPENQGKVFLMRYGKKIFDKLNEAMNPEFADETAFNPFDLWTGANFKIKIRQVEGYRNYDKSEFSDPAPLSDDDSELEVVWKQCHSLQQFLAPSEFKPYAELKAKLHRTLGLDGQAGDHGVQPAPTKAPPASMEVDLTKFKGTKAPVPPTKTPVVDRIRGVDDPSDVPFDVDAPSGEEDEGLDFFRRLAS